MLAWRQRRAVGNIHHCWWMQDVINKLPFGSSGFGCDMTTAINYVNCMFIDFASENDLELYLKSRDEIMTSELYGRLAAAGLKRQVVSKVWNKDQFRISVVFEYSSKEAFEECLAIFGELERSEFMDKFAVKFQNNRGVVISEFEA